MMTTPQRIGLYQDAILRWLAAKRDHPGLHHPEPDRSDYQLDQWTANKTKQQTEADFNRKI